MSATQGYLNYPGAPSSGRRLLYGWAHGSSPTSAYDTGDRFRLEPTPAANRRVSFEGTSLAGIGSDALENATAIRDGWLRYLCRTDDLLVHSSGEMTNPLPTEQAVLSECAEFFYPSP